MFTQLLLPLATAIFFILLFLALRSREARAQARVDFARFMTRVLDWSEKDTDYQETASTIAALNAHLDRLLLSENTVSPQWIGSAANRHYLAEYQQCHDRHRMLLAADTSEHAVAIEQAQELELAIKKLTSLSGDRTFT